MRRRLKLGAALVGLVALGLFTWAQVASGVEIGENQSAIICHATPPDGPPNKYEVIVTDDETIANGHLQEHDADVLLAVIDKPPDQVTKAERDAFLDQCNALLTTTTTAPEEEPPTAPPAPPVEGEAPFTG
jgi:hypothetical protein